MARLLARLRAEDRGITLIETLVALVIMSVVMSIFTGGVIAMFKVANRNDAMSELQSQLNIVFVKLDKEIRYASAVSSPLIAPNDSGNDYVEYLISKGGVPTCVQLRLNGASKQLQRRTWTQGGTTIDSPGWLPLASNVTAPERLASDGSPKGPFSLIPAEGATLVQRLTIRLKITAGRLNSVSSRRNEYTFSSLNSSASTPATYCTEGRTLP